MEDWFWTLLAFIGAVGQQWVDYIAGGVLIFAFGIIERLLERSARKRTYAVLCVLVLIVSCFFAWRDQYIRNIGHVDVHVYLPNMMSPKDDYINEQFIIINTTQHVAVIRDIMLGCITLVDPNITDQVTPHCLD